MRFIKTNNSIAEFIETDKTGKIISSRGFQFGVIYFEIKNKKVAFYLDNDEQPFQNFVWSTDIPLTIDDVEYETEEEVSAALHSIFNDRFQEQLDKVKEDLAAEEARAQEAEEQLDDKIDDESARAIAAENRLQNQVTELSGAVAVLDNRVTDVENDLSALTDTVNDEITRSVAKDAEHDALISGLTDDLASEVARATTRENQIDANLNAEIARATNAENALDTKIDNEITRSTAKDASHDTLISGLTTNLQNETNRAVGAENSLRNDLNSETSARTNADAAMLERIVAVEVGKADANSVYTKAESDAKYATKDYISGLTDEFFDDVIYDKQTKRINFYNGNRIKAFVDASDFVKDGMVSDVRIANNNLVITFNTDAGKDAISIPLTDIFDPANYYTKSEVDSALSSKADKTDVIAISGDVMALSTKVDTISGEVNTIKEEIDDIDLSNYYTKGESDGKYQLKGDYVTGAQMSAYTYDKQTIDGKVNDKVDIFTYLRHISDTVVHVSAGEKGTWNSKQDKLVSGTNIKTINNESILGSGNIDIQGGGGSSYTAGDGIDITNDVISVTGKVDTSAFTAHTADTTIHVTSAEKNTWNNKSDFSGNYNDLTNKPTIHTYTAGTGIDITNDVISVTGGSEPVDAYTKAESDAKFATITNFNSHSGNTNVHVTTTEKNTWNAKADASNVYTKSEVDNKLSAKPNVWCGNESEWSQISGSTESGTIYLVY